MAQPQSHIQQAPARTFSPAQPSPSPAPMPGLTLPASKRPRVSPGPATPQPSSPYQAQQQQLAPQQQYNQGQQQQQQYQQQPPQQQPPIQYQQQPIQYGSPVGTPTPTTPAQTPMYQSVASQQQQQQQQQYSTPTPHQNAPYQNNVYQNGTPAASLHLPPTQPQVYHSAPPTPIPQLAPATPLPQHQQQQQQYTPAILAPVGMPAAPTPPPLTPGPGVMGPPSKPAERPVKENDNHDVTDTLAGTGVDLRAEEQALTEYYAGSFGKDSRYGFPANAPGSRASMYGAGTANQPAELPDGKTQEQVELEAAEAAWDNAAFNLGTIRSIEIKSGFLTPAILQRRAATIAQKHDINLNLDLKNPTQTMGKMKPPEGWPQPKLNVNTKVGADGAMVTVTEAWIPHDAYLVDQIALLSLATKHRVRQMLEDSFHIASARQKTAHGDVPAEWADVAAPIVTGTDNANVTPVSGGDGDSAVSPRTTSLKRSHEAISANSALSAVDTVKSTNYVTAAMRKHGMADRDAEEARLRKRQKRANPELASATSRAGSIAPGATPTEGDNKLSKKEIKEMKKAAGGGGGGKGRKGEVSDAASTATANQTVQHLLGKKKGNKYAWMTGGGGGGGGGGSASGASTPGRLNTTGLPGTPTGGIGSATKTPEKARLTQEGRNRLGMWREDGDKGKGIQMRDWVTALEADGTDKKAIQAAYMKLDESIAAKETSMV